jgi:predicted transcriptional regulator
MVAKVTFSLDQETVRSLRQLSERMKKPKSAVLREAIREYREREDHVSEAERLSRVAALRQFLAENPPRDESETQKELDEIRAARRGGGRLHGADEGGAGELPRKLPPIRPRAEIKGRSAR